MPDVRSSRCSQLFVYALVAAPLLLSACASWPSLTGHETLAELRDANDGHAHRNDGAHLSSSDCWLERDAGACAWLSAFWQADYEQAQRLCETSPKQEIPKAFLNKFPCRLAAAYALGCYTVRGHPSGASDEPAKFIDANQGVGPSCVSPDPFPAELIHAPEIDVDKALGFLVTGCRLGAQDDCEMMVEVLLAGLISGIPVPQDFKLAHEFFVRAQQIGHPRESAKELEWSWRGIWAKDKLAETPGERDERIGMVAGFYDRGARFNAALSSQVEAHVNSSSTLSAISAGLSAGMATNAAVNSNLAAAQGNIHATVAASDAGHGHAKLAAQLNAANRSQAQQQKLAQAQSDQAAANTNALEEKKAKLEACLAEDINCEYGTSNKCAPSVAYGDRFGARRVIETARQQAKLCDPSTSDTWAAECYAPRIQPHVTDSRFLALAGLMNDASARFGKLPSRYKTAAPACFGKLLPIPQVVTGLSDLCRLGKKLCLDNCDIAEAQVDCMHDVDEFLYTAEFQRSRDDLKRAHDASCHKQLD